MSRQSDRDAELEKLLYTNAVLTNTNFVARDYATEREIELLGRTEFMLRRAGKDQPEVFTTRWAMSYLRGPMTRDQIDTIMAPTKALAAPAAAASAETAPERDAEG